MSDTPTFQEPLTPDQLEEVFHAALGLGDARGVDAALRLMVVQDPRRAADLYEKTRTALAIASIVQQDPDRPDRREPTMTDTHPTTEHEDPEEKRRTAAGQLDEGGEVTADHAAMLATALFEIADAAGMPDSFRESDSRMQLARAVLVRLGLPVDDEEDGDDDDL